MAYGYFSGVLVVSESDDLGVYIAGPIFSGNPHMEERVQHSQRCKFFLDTIVPLQPLTK